MSRRVTSLRFAPPRVDLERLESGEMRLTSPLALEPYPSHLGVWLKKWATEAPDRIFLAERTPEGPWRRLTYSTVAAAVDSVAQSLLDRGLSAETPVAILSDNGIDQALLQLAAMKIGIPVVPVSPAYSLLSSDFARLKYIVELTKPGMIYVNDGESFAKALAASGSTAAEVVVSRRPPQGIPATLFGDLTANLVGPAVAQAQARVGPDTVAKILFTSGSTGTPKGVINTQRMLCSNQLAIRQLWPFLSERPPVVVDWLPWNHTFGGNHNFNLVLANGGTFYIDHGKPTPELIERTAANLREISPTLYFNVPRGFDLLLPFLETDAALRQSFFRDLDFIFYAGAALPQHLWERLEQLSLKARGLKVPLLSAWGATETAPMATTVHFPIDRAGVIGLPAPGCELKLVPVRSKLEMRVRGPNVTPGYFKRPDLTRESFDQDGFFRTGDAGRLADPEDPSRGVVFDGRTSEDFKLMSGTWVHVGLLRVSAVAAGAPVIQDAVITGQGREEIGLLVFPSLAGCRSLCPDLGPAAPLTEVLLRPEVRERLAEGLSAHNRAQPANSTRIARVLLMTEPPSIDANEITDKGYINQQAVLARRAALVERLYSAADEPDVIAIP